MFPRTTQALHDMAARARVQAKAVTIPMEQAARMRATTDFMEAGEREHAHLARALVDMFTQDGELHPAIAAVFERAAGPSAQFDWLLELAILVIGIFSAAGTLVAPEMQDLLNKAWERNLDVPATVEQLALAELRGYLTHDHALKLARETGYSPDKYDIIYADMGEPPAIQELLFLWRRGKVDTDRLVRGIRQSRVRDEWVDAIEALAFAPPSAQQAVAAAVQGHLTAEDAQKIVAENGIDPGAYGWLYETAGRPPGARELTDLMHRGLLSRDQVVQGIRESDVKDKYIDAVIAAGDYIPPVRSVVAMLRAGAIDDAHATQLFRENGVRDTDIAGYIAEASHGRTATAREVTQASIVAAYRDGVLNRGDAHGRLLGLRYSDADAVFLLDLADAETAAQLQRQVITTTRARYVSGKVDKATATATLDSAHVDPAQRDRLLATWDLERGESERPLTPAVLVKGVKNGAVDGPTFYAQMSRNGYTHDDAALFAAIEGVGAQVGP